MIDYGLLLAVITTLCGALSFAIAAIWKLAKKNYETEERLKDLELFQAKIKPYIKGEIEDSQTLIAALNSEKFGRLIAKHESNKQRILLLLNKIETNSSNINDIKQHIVGLEHGLRRNNIAIRVEDDWLNNAIQLTRLDDGEDGTINISGIG